MNKEMYDDYKADLIKAKNEILAAAKRTTEGRNAISNMKKSGFTEAGILSLLISRMHTKSQVEQIIDDLLMGCYDNRCPTKAGSVSILVELLVEDAKAC
jgi:hypothetical protein